ncbi:hypothetical protein FIV00_04325 [Labrenzia sp. THAF82]|uniref:GNAT family N-acetyltransferase n=1 Tax=Labrenzia sp. THAF82 TaxID=2587861 RepID=UPI0012681DA0|nr:GNAT family N-acetyltransferase [Labrenzia sp. THAF82]QFT29695.1 hypothetical protein FIV00_04325 [Labrenzia sp. THAF82]
MISDQTAAQQYQILEFDPLSATVPEADWRQLAKLSIDPNPFFGPEFLKPFLEHTANRAVRLVVVREKQKQYWLAAAPVGRRRLGIAFPVTSTWATEYSPLGTPLLHPDASQGAIAAFLHAMGGSKGVLAFPYLPLHSASADRLRSAMAERYRSTACATRAAHAAGETGNQQLESAYSGKRRKEMRRLLRRLDDHGTTRFSSLSGHEAVQGFESFLHLEAKGWKGRAGTALLSTPETAAFARAAIANRSAEDGVRIDQLWAGNTLVAALVLFVEGGAVFSWKIAFDEEFARYSPGAQIAVHAFRENLKLNGFKGADSLAIPGHTMIEPLWRGRLETCTLLYSGGAFSAQLCALCQADLELEQRLRRLVRQLKKRVRP